MDAGWLLLALLLLVIALIALIVVKLNARHQRMLDEVKGVRVRLERAAEDVQLASEKEHREARKLRLNIYRQFREWLQHTRSP